MTYSKPTSHKCAQCGETKPIAAFGQVQINAHKHKALCKVCRGKLRATRKPSKTYRKYSETRTATAAAILTKWD